MNTLRRFQLKVGDPNDTSKTTKVKVGQTDEADAVLADVCKKFKVDPSEFVLYWVENDTFFTEGTLKDASVANGALFHLRPRSDMGPGLLYGVSIVEGQTAHPEIDVPIVVERCIQHITDTALEAEGIFRLAGSVTGVQELKKQYDVGDDPVLAKIDDPHVVAGALKLYLRELPEPILTYGLYDYFIAAGQPNKRDVRIEYLRCLVRMLPTANFAVLRKLCVFLSLVASKSEVNRMGFPNLSTVFGPNMMRKEVEDIATMIEHTPVVNQITSDLMQFHERIFSEGECLYVGCGPCLYDYTGPFDAGQLAFTTGDIVFVSWRGSEGWYEASLRGTVGLVPANHVEEKMTFSAGEGRKLEEVDMTQTGARASMMADDVAAALAAAGAFDDEPATSDASGGGGGGGGGKKEVIAHVRALEDLVNQSTTDRAALEKRCEALAATVEELTAKHAETMATLERVEASGGPKAAAPAAASGESGGSEGEVEDLRNEVGSLKRQLANAKEAMVSAKSALSKLKNKLDSEKEARKAAEAKLVDGSSAGAELAAAQARVSELETELSLAETKLEAAKAGGAEVMGALAKVAQLEAKLAQKDEQIEELQGQASLEATSVSMRDSEIASLKEEINLLKVKLEKEESARATLEKQVNEATDDNVLKTQESAKLTLTVQELNDTIGELRKNLETTTAEKDKVASERSAAVEELAALKKEKAALQDGAKDVVTLQNKLDERDAEVAELGEQLAAAKVEAAKAVASAQESENANTTELEELRAKTDALTRTMLEERAKVKALEAELEEARASGAADTGPEPLKPFSPALAAERNDASSVPNNMGGNPPPAAAPARISAVGASTDMEKKRANTAGGAPPNLDATKSSYDQGVEVSKTFSGLLSSLLPVVAQLNDGDDTSAPRGMLFEIAGAVKQMQALVDPVTSDNLKTNLFAFLSASKEVFAEVTFGDEKQKFRAAAVTLAGSMKEALRGLSA